MPTQMQYTRESVESALKQIKPEIRNLSGYTSPPQGEVIAKLNQNENPYDLPQEWKKNILLEMKELTWSRYPEYSPLNLREKLAQRFDLDSAQILLGNGSNQALYTVITSIVSAGDRVILSVPTFSLFEPFALVSQGNIIKIDKGPDFSDNTERLFQEVKSAKLTMFSSPDNPSGHVMELETLEQILKQTPGLVLWDEAYGEFWGKSAIPLISKYPNLLITRTFSKAFGLAGLRIGYLIGNRDLITEFQKVNIPYNLNLFSILVALYLLDNLPWMESHVKKIISERKSLFLGMKQIPQVTPYPSEANFILFKVPDGPRVLKDLQEQGILVRNVNSHLLLKNCLRVTVGTQDENIAFIKALGNLFTERTGHAA